jgi:flagellar P-ring protein precursor FlgI
LQGGTLIMTPLKAADGEIYAVGQGAVIVSGFTAQGQAEQLTQGVPTAGRVPNGAIVERSVPALIVPGGQLRTNLLGMTFLNRLESWQVKGDRLMLRGYP